MKRLAVVGAVVVMAAALTGCEDRKCLQPHTDIIPIVQVNPQGQPYTTWIPVETCDKYEEPKP